MHTLNPPEAYSAAVKGPRQCKAQLEGNANAVDNLTTVQGAIIDEAGNISPRVERDLVATRHIYSTREGSTFAVRHNPSHEWYYLSDQTPDEVTLIKMRGLKHRQGTFNTSLGDP
ncbi:hypothetical protein EDC04DRAFT_2614718 [Pisolithus marmoratus]|nr:hypothetical protein EDC04DRAFT_2614718 [Pisolithus marmoratus]